MTLTLAERIEPILQSHELFLCRHCAKEIRLNESVLWWLGKREYYHPELVDGATDAGANRNGLFCDSSLEHEAEPMEDCRRARTAGRAERLRVTHGVLRPARDERAREQ